MQKEPNLYQQTTPDVEATCEQCGQSQKIGEPFYGLRCDANLAGVDEPELYLCHAHYKEWVDNINQLIANGELDEDYWQTWEVIVYTQ